VSDPVETPVDLTAQANSRVAIQYRNSTKFLAFIASQTALLQEIETALLAIPPLDDLDVATGVNLVVTADLVGQQPILLNGDVLDDAELSLLAKARITRNHAHATGEDLITLLADVFAAQIRIFDFGGMVISYSIGRVVTTDEQAILNSGAGGTIIARPMGVQVLQSYFDPTAYFGFSDDPNAKGFSDDTTRGAGHLAEGF
jgi:hypothetical protein